MKKHGGWPVSIGVDLDNTTFGPKSGVTHKIIEWRNRFSAVLFCLMDHEKLPGTTFAATTKSGSTETHSFYYESALR